MSTQPSIGAERPFQSIIAIANAVDWPKMAPGRKLTSEEKADIAGTLKNMHDRSCKLRGVEAQANAVKLIVDELRKLGITTTTTAEMETLIIKLGYQDLWDRDPDAKDEYGLRRSMGDRLGGGELGLQLNSTMINNIKYYQL